GLSEQVAAHLELLVEQIAVRPQRVSDQLADSPLERDVMRLPAELEERHLRLSALRTGTTAANVRPARGDRRSRPRGCGGGCPDARRELPVRRRTGHDVLDVAGSDRPLQILDSAPIVTDSPA